MKKIVKPIIFFIQNMSSSPSVADIQSFVDPDHPFPTNEQVQHTIDDTRRIIQRMIQGLFSSLSFLRLFPSRKN